MSEVEILLRNIMGIFFIIYGLAMCVLEKFYVRKYGGRWTPHGFYCILIGIVVSAYTLGRGLLVGIIALSLWGIEQLIILKIEKQKNI